MVVGMCASIFSIGKGVSLMKAMPVFLFVVVRNNSSMNGVQPTYAMFKYWTLVFSRISSWASLSLSVFHFRVPLAKVYGVQYGIP